MQSTKKTAEIRGWRGRLHVALASVVVCAAVASPGGELYDVVVVGAGPAGIGAALASARAGAKTALLERDSVVGGTTVQAAVCDIGLFYAWKRQIIAGPAWDLVTNAVAAAHGTLPDFSAQRPDKWMESCVHVEPEVYSRIAEDTLRRAGVALLKNAEVLSVSRTAAGWDAGFAVGRQVVDATGNAAVAALAGARRVKSPDDLRQPGSFFFWLSSKDAKFNVASVERAFRKAVAEGELLPTDVHVGMAHFIRKGGGSGCYVPLADNSTPAARADTNRRGIEARDRVLAFIRRQPGLGDVALVASAREVGVRETYRVVGEKTITERGYLDGVVEDDALCWSYWMVDAHSATRMHARLVFHAEGRVGSVPLGAMLPKGVADMLVAGRAVSSDHGGELRAARSGVVHGDGTGGRRRRRACRREAVRPARSPARRHKGETLRDGPHRSGELKRGGGLCAKSRGPGSAQGADL